MQKIVIHKAGDYRQLRLETHPDLNPSDDTVVVDVRGCGVNYADVLVRWGIYESAKQLVGWPITPGFEFAGVVKECGKNTGRFALGQKVFGVTLFNAYASEVVVPESQLYALPESMSFEEAAAFPAVFLTAYHALFQNIVARPGMTALIHSAAGGVGSSLVQLCKIFGIRTIGVVGSSHKTEFLESLCCDVVIDKSTSDLWPEVEKHAPQGVDLCFDANGLETLRQSYNHLSTCGKLVSYGAHSMLPKTGGKINWPKLALNYLRAPRFNPLEMTSENKSLITFNLSFLFARQDLFQEGMSALLGWYAEQRLRLPPVKTFKLSEVAEAHRALESGATVGKLVLLP